MQYLKVMRKFPTDYVPTRKDHSFLMKFLRNEVKGLPVRFSQLQTFKPDSKLFVWTNKKVRIFLLLFRKLIN